MYKKIMLSLIISAAGLSILTHLFQFLVFIYNLHVVPRESILFVPLILFSFTGTYIILDNKGVK